MSIPWRDILADAPVEVRPGVANAKRANQANPVGPDEPEGESLAKLAALALARIQDPAAELAADRAAKVAAMDLGTFGGLLEDGAEGKPGRVGAPLAAWQAPTTTPEEIEAPRAADAGGRGSQADPHLFSHGHPTVGVGDTTPQAGKLPRGIPEARPLVTPGGVLLALADHGISAALDGGQIRLRPSAAVTPTLLAMAKENKAALSELLRCAGAVPGPRVLTPKGPGLLRWRGYSGRLGVVLDGDPNAWHFFSPQEVNVTNESEERIPEHGL